MTRRSFLGAQEWEVEKHRENREEPPREKYRRCPPVYTSPSAGAPVSCTAEPGEVKSRGGAEWQEFTRVPLPEETTSEQSKHLLDSLNHRLLVLL
ncbi:hypothetical protein AMECASPLE_009870 [Ameca splendens]|uniref:Uncharacterized protein n=1 Tax=Ameca splendens TaxID=208324 RepID=A0ABV0ZAG3_9TELE